MKMKQVVMIYTALISSFAVVMAYFITILAALFKGNGIAVMQFNGYGEMYIEVIALAMIVAIDVIVIMWLWSVSYAGHTMRSVQKESTQDASKL